MQCMLWMVDLKVGAKDILAFQNQSSLAQLMIDNFRARVLCQFNMSVIPECWLCSSTDLIHLKLRLDCHPLALPSVCLLCCNQIVCHV